MLSVFMQCWFISFSHPGTVQAVFVYVQIHSWKPHHIGSVVAPITFSLKTSVITEGHSPFPVFLHLNLIHLFHPNYSNVFILSDKLNILTVCVFSFWLKWIIYIYIYKSIWGDYFYQFWVFVQKHGCFSMYLSLPISPSKQLTILYMLLVYFWNRTISLEISLPKLLGRIGFGYIPHLWTNHHGQEKVAFRLNEELHWGQGKRGCTGW